MIEPARKCPVNDKLIQATQHTECNRQKINHAQTDKLHMYQLVFPYNDTIFQARVVPVTHTAVK